VDGTGDWFSRYGIVRMWVTRVEEQTRAKARKDFEQEEENEN
jgi:transposase